MIALILAVVAAAGFVIATLLVDSTLGTSRRFNHISVVVAAGILLGIAFVDLIPETFELLEGTNAALAIAAGFLALFLVETLTGGHTHHHEPHAPGEAHTLAHAHDQAGDECVPAHAIAPFLIGLGFHNFADGLVIGATHEVSEAASIGAAIGILIHQFPVGLSFASVLLASGVAVAKTRRDAILIGSLIPIGALAVLAAPDLSASTLGAVIGVAAGALLYIASGHLLPEAQSEHRRPGVAAAFATALLVTVLVIGATHGHAEDDAHGDGSGRSDNSERDGE